MKLRHLRFFTAVVECGGIGKAGERLNVSQPAISAGLKALEEDLGEPLFDRRPGRRRIVPTPRALQFYQRALDILRQCEAARAEFKQKEAGPPRLRIGVISTIDAGRIVGMAQWFAKHGSAWRWRIWEGTHTQLAGWLRQGRLDVAVTAVEQTSEHQVLWKEPFVVLASPTFHLAKGNRASLSVSDLNDEPLILRGTCELRAGQLREAGLLMRVAARTSRDEIALRLVAQGVGVALAPRSLASKDVAVLPIVDLHLSRTIALISRPGLPRGAELAVRHAIASTNVTP